MIASLTLRPAAPADAPRLRRLAALDSGEPPGDALVAELESDLLAAISIRDGRVVADPFQRTDHAVGLLRVRRDQIVQARRLSRPGHALRASAMRRAIRLPAAA